MTKKEAILEAMEYYAQYADLKLQETGVPMRVRVVELWHDSMGYYLPRPVYAWHDCSADVFAKDSWRNEPTVMIIE